MRRCIAFILIITAIIVPKHIFAETIVGGLYVKPTIWTKVGSPYIIKNSTTFLNTSLRIDAGVEVRFEKDIFFRNSSLFITGTVSKPVTFVANNTSSYFLAGEGLTMNARHLKLQGKENSHFLNAWKGSAVSIEDIKADDFGSGTFISVFDNTDLHIADMKLTDWNGKGIELYASSSLFLKNSDMIHVDRGVYVFLESSIDIQDSLFEANTKAIQIQTSDAVIRKTDFEQNQYAILQDVDDGAFRLIDATENWFGTSTHPNTQDINKISGNIHFTPWSKTKNRTDIKICCSNVLFFPGLMGSRLYQKSNRYENQLWEPNRNTDVKKLFMNKYGEAIEPGIYTRDILSKTNIFGGILLDKSIYKDFVSDMNSLASKKVIRHFDMIPYDWRFTPDTLLQEGILFSNGTSTFTRYVVDSIQQSAKDSKTGKVTLITHSNGGLVVKYLLAYAKKNNIYLPVDKVIYVGMPEHGTPQAITSLLFGHEQSVAGGLILKSSVARDLGKNMPTAYTLLPQKEYFNHTSSVLVGNQTINTTDELKQTLARGSSIFNQDLFEKAKSIHAYTQSESISNIQQFQIVGVGVPTVKGFVQQGKRAFPLYDNFGDGVVERSGGRVGIVAEVDLHDTGHNHADMMNESNIRQHIYSILSNNAPTTSLGLDIKAETYDRLIIEDLEPMVDPIELRFMPTIGTPITYKNTTSSFIELKGDSRWKSFNNGLEYVDTTNELKQTPMRIQGRSLATTSIQYITQSGTTGNIQIQTYENIPLYIPATVTLDTGHLTVSSADADIQKRIEPASIVEVEENGVVSTIHVSTSTKTITERLLEAKRELASSTVGFYLKTRYVRYIDQLQKKTESTQKDATLLVIEKIKRSIKNIDHYSNNPTLRSRYSASRRDYVRILYILESVIAK